MKCRGWKRGVVGLLLLVALFQSRSLLAQGLYVPVGGPINRSMGGAGTAAPLDAIGALYWNPATTSGLASSEMSFGMDLVLADLEVESTNGAASGATGAEPGVVPIPTVGVVYKPENSRVTYGLGLLGVAGFKTNFPADPANPILAPAPTGLGRIFTEAEFLQMAPTVSYAVTDRFSIGFGPTVTMGKVAIDPLVFAAPNAPGVFPSGRGTRVAWGGGAQLGMYYIADNCWHWGTSVKSPQWMEEFRYHTEDAAGGPRVEKVKIDLPMIVSVGTAYTGMEKYVFALDLRYLDYKNTDLFGGHGFKPDGSLRGLGWSNIFSLAAGLQYTMNDRLTMRTGYTYSQPVSKDSETFFNIGSPLYYQHLLHIGSSFQVTEKFSMNMAYSYLLPDKTTGPAIINPGTVTSKETAHILNMGMQVRF